MIYYGIPTYTQYQRAKEAVYHIISTSTVIPDMFIIVDNSEKGLAAPIFEPLVTAYPHNIILLPRVKNNLAGAWNDLMSAVTRDYMIIANDDVLPHPHAIRALVDTAIQHSEYAMVNGSGHSGNSYSFFLLKRWAYEKVGPFDEGFDPAYFEDNDYDRRIKCAGLRREEAVHATFDHYGSATIKHMVDRTAHHKAFERNRRRFEEKWGGMPGQETTCMPFSERNKILDDE